MIAADCHVLVSTNECSPLVNLEGMALGTICVSSRVHGIPEVLEDGVTGRLADPEDIASIEECLAWYVDKHEHAPGDLDAMRVRARNFVAAHHDVTHTVEVLSREIAAQLDSPPRKRLLGARGDQFVLAQLVRRWAMVKGDATVETHLARSFAHELFDPDDRQ
jgi:hypothetical protein